MVTQMILVHLFWVQILVGGQIKYNSNLIIVDYAHTPDAMIKVFEVAHEVTKGNVYVVFGCTGDRDKDKRIKMSRSIVLDK